MPEPLVLVLSHHKCGSSWLTAVFREAAFRLGWRFRVVHRPEDWERKGYGSLAAFVAGERPRILSYTNAEAAHLDGLPGWRGVHVVRDPRDVWVSGYFSHLTTHPTRRWPELEAHRAALEGVSKAEGLRLELDFSAWVFEQLGAWPYGRVGVLETTLEALSADPAAGFAEAFAHVGMVGEPDGPLGRLSTAALLRLNPLHWRGRGRLGFRLSPFRVPLPALPAAAVGAVVARQSFERLSGGRARGEEDRRSHYRKGQPGDWANHLTPELLAAFEARFGGLVGALGYR